MAFLFSLYIDSFARSWWIAFHVQVPQWLLTVQGKGKQGLYSASRRVDDVRQNASQ